jgi:uncharacterized coiled-coil protein SlyX
MAFTVNDLHDLVEILYAEPAWRAEIRKLVLTDELLNLPQEIRELTALVRQLTEAQLRNEERFARMEERFAHNDARFARIESDIVELKADVSQLKTDVSQLKTDVGDLKGSDLERKVRERPFVYLSRFARKLRAVSDAELAEIVENALDHEDISEAEGEEIKRIDSVAYGRRKSDGINAYLTVEVSSVIDEYDVSRAVRRSAFLAKAARQAAMPIVAGKLILPAARTAIEQAGGGWASLPSENGE